MYVVLSLIYALSNAAVITKTKKTVSMSGYKSSAFYISLISVVFSAVPASINFRFQVCITSITMLMALTAGSCLAYVIYMKLLEYVACSNLAVYEKLYLLLLLVTDLLIGKIKIGPYLIFATFAFFIGIWMMNRMTGLCSEKKDKESKLKMVALLIVCSSVWAINPYLIEISSKEAYFNSQTFVFLSTIMMTIFLWKWSGAKTNITKDMFADYCYISLFETTCNVSYYIAVVLGPPSIVGIVASTDMLVILLMEKLTGRREITKMQMIGAIISFVGIAGIIMLKG